MNQTQRKQNKTKQIRKCKNVYLQAKMTKKTKQNQKKTKKMTKKTKHWKTYIKISENKQKQKHTKILLNFLEISDISKNN